MHELSLCIELLLMSHAAAEPMLRQAWASARHGSNNREHPWKTCRVCHAVRAALCCPAAGLRSPPEVHKEAPQHARLHAQHLQGTRHMGLRLITVMQNMLNGISRLTIRLTGCLKPYSDAVASNFSIGCLLRQGTQSLMLAWLCTHRETPSATSTASESASNSSRFSIK